MHIRTRKLIGTIALLVLVVIWALLAMGFAQMLELSRNRVIEIAYYIVAGLGWVLPAMPLISWMSRPDPDAQAPES
jgi:predicted membrane channel-forming protein YqfA (hemolysin III family)